MGSLPFPRIFYTPGICLMRIFLPTGPSDGSSDRPEPRSTRARKVVFAANYHCAIFSAALRSVWAPALVVCLYLWRLHTSGFDAAVRMGWSFAVRTAKTLFSNSWHSSHGTQRIRVVSTMGS
jgi:hypothetical protein